MRYRSVVLFLMLGLTCGCSSYQPTKEVWKGTKSLWYTYASPPASVDYGDKGDLTQGALRLSQSMLGIDQELTRFERVMLNADKPPSQEWITNFLLNFPWMNGLAGVKYDGTILGQEPATPVKVVDFIPLLYEDPKQKRSALRGDVQMTPQGPEVLLAAPLYESAQFLGIVCAHFDMRTLATQFDSAQHLVILSPYGLLWPGQYDFAQTPLAGIDWEKVVKESSSGACSNSAGKFLYQVRYLGNLPLIFAVAESDSFPKGDGSFEKNASFFPKERPKLPPPPQPERVEKEEKGIPVFGKPEEMVPDILPPAGEQGQQMGEAPQGPPEGVVKEKRRKRQVRRERVLVPVMPEPEPMKPVKVTPDLDLGPDVKGPTLPGGRPSPFGAPTAKDEQPKAQEAVPAVPAVPAKEAPKPADKQSVEPQAPKEHDSSTQPKMLPGGRPSPFGS